MSSLSSCNTILHVGRVSSVHLCDNFGMVCRNSKDQSTLNTANHVIMSGPISTNHRLHNNTSAGESKRVRAHKNGGIPWRPCALCRHPVRRTESTHTRPETVRGTEISPGKSMPVLLESRHPKFLYAESSRKIICTIAVVFANICLTALPFHRQMHRLPRAPFVHVW